MNDCEKDLIKEKINRLIWLRKLFIDELEHSSVISFTGESTNITLYKLKSFDDVVEAFGIEPIDITNEIVCDGAIKRSIKIKGVEFNVYALKGSDEYENAKRALDL